MEDWKARQKAYNHMTTNHRDDLTGIDVLNRPEFIVEDALMHFDKRVDQVDLPSEVVLRCNLLCQLDSRRLW